MLVVPQMVFQRTVLQNISQRHVCCMPATRYSAKYCTDALMLVGRSTLCPYTVLRVAKARTLHCCRDIMLNKEEVNIAVTVYKCHLSEKGRCCMCSNTAGAAAYSCVCPNQDCYYSSTQFYKHIIFPCFPYLPSVVVSGTADMILKDCTGS
jgi:hypothetical protein